MRHSIWTFAVTAALAMAGTAHASVIWRGDFETGNRSQWSRGEMMDPDRLQVVESPTREGRYALRAEVRKGDDPINASGNRAELIRQDGSSEGNEYYYGWSTMLPADYPLAAGWQVLMQWHHPGNNGAPPVRFVLGCGASSCGTPLTDTLLFIVNGKTVWRMAPMTRGGWHDFVLHVKWSANPGVGFVELWYDGQLVLPKTMTRTLFHPGDANYIKMGLYREEAIAPTQVLYQDALTQATTYEEAAPGGGAAPAAGADPASGPAPAGSTPAPAPAPQVMGDLGPGGPLDGPQAGCSQGATSAVSIAGLLSALGGLALRRRRRR